MFNVWIGMLSRLNRQQLSVKNLPVNFVLINIVTLENLILFLDFKWHDLREIIGWTFNVVLLKF